MTQWRVIFHRLQIFELVYNLHSLGIVHGDLEPRNVVRTDRGTFLLIDFTESWMHQGKMCVAQNVRHLVVDSHCIYELTLG
jgi:RIO-like serine/threonine protein kinase